MFVSIANPLAESFTYFGVGLLGFKWLAVEFDRPATGPLVGSGEEDSVMEESLVAGAGVGERVWLGGDWRRYAVLWGG